MFTLAHLSDPHLSPLPTPRMHQLFGKRMVGYVNWRLRRSQHHDPDALAAIERDLREQKPDHIAVLGDLVNICLPDEFPAAAKFLARLGTPRDVTLVPGNHDAYTRAHAHTFLDVWGDYLAGDRPAPAERFPFVRKRGPLALIGLSTALPTLPFLATGTLGEMQLERLPGILASLREEGLFRVVLIHHPPLGLRAPHRVLTDADAFRDVIAQVGAELVLHGHDHRPSLLELEGPEGGVPLVGVASASAPAADSRPAAWNLFRIGDVRNGWNCEMEIRGLQPDGGVRTVERRSLR